MSAFRSNVHKGRSFLKENALINAQKEHIFTDKYANRYVRKIISFTKVFVTCNVQITAHLSWILRVSILVQKVITKKEDNACSEEA